jgi:ABC-2 type transport system ATP-binding protein
MIGVVPEDLALFERLTGRQYLTFCGRMYGLDADESHRRAEELLALTELAYKADTLVADYSKGMRRRIAIAAAVIHGPGVLFLDEPFEGIDVIAAAVVRELLKELKRAGVTLFLTTHVLEIADRLATHAGVIRAGRIEASGTVEELKAKFQANQLEDVFNAVIGTPKAAGARLSWLVDQAA